MSTMNTKPTVPQNPIPNQNPNQRMQHPFAPSQLDQPMSQQLNRFYQPIIAGSDPAPANLNPVVPPYGNFGTAFNPMSSIPFNGVQPKAMFNNHGFVNRGDLLHNNLYDNVLREEIREYSILIDSKDRNFDVYPNPFHYKVTFNPLPTDRVNGVILHETPNPVIHENMCNVRYISLEEVILPLFTKVKYTQENDDIPVAKLDVSRPLTEYLYTVLQIEEYSNINHRSTNDTLSNSFATIYFDEVVNNTHYMGRTKGGIKVFQPDQLGEINSLTIKFMNPYGEILTVNHFDEEINSISNCTCDDNIIADDCFQHNACHPLFPPFQHHLHLRIGIIEPRLSKIIFS